MNHLLHRLCALGLILVAGSAWASISVGSGGSISLGNGVLNLGGGNLRVEGEFQVANGRVLDAGTVLIDGTLDGGAGEFQLGGDWINNGAFNAGIGSVIFTDATGDNARIVGDSNFFSLALVSSAGAAFVLESGSIQRVANLLAIQGASEAPVQIQSSNPPQIAQLFLEPGGVQDIAFVGVSNVHATGERLAPEQANQGGSGNALGWFGIGLTVVPVPLFSAGGLIFLLLALLGIAWLRLGRMPV